MNVKVSPLLFNAPMVRAIIAEQKTLTRRAFSEHMMKQMRAAATAGEVSHFLDEGSLQPNDLAYVRQFSPVGQPGDHIYVRETWAETDLPCGTPVITYKAGGHAVAAREWSTDRDYLIPGSEAAATPEPDQWRPSIHMPKWAARIWLEVTGVRVERLQDISDADCLYEGIEDRSHGWAVYGTADGITLDPIRSYRSLWEQINGPGSWDLNPWVWVVEFKRIEGTPA